MTIDLNSFDSWLKDDGPVALVIRQPLMSAEGEDGVLFPATFAAAEDKKLFAGGYNIDGHEEGENVCIIDTVGSQANRIEPKFAEERYAALIPQIVVKAGDKEVNLLDAGHRAGDALIRCSSRAEELRAAFQAVLKGDATPLAKIAPTSLVFGVWDSRDTQAKLPRLVSSTIRAYNVRRLTRSAVYVPPVDYSALDVFSEEEKAKAEGDSKNPLAKRGFVHVPASGSHGGVRVIGSIRRDAMLSISALRLLSAGKDKEKTLALRRYILGLALTAFTMNTSGYLRAGCNLVPNPEKARELTLVQADGRREASSLTHDDALKYAELAAKAFSVEKGGVIPFEAERAKKDVTGEEGTEKKKGGKKK